MKANCEKHGEQEFRVNGNYDALCPKCFDAGIKSWLTRERMNEIARVTAESDLEAPPTGRGPVKK